MSFLVQLIFNGLIIGAVYSMVSVGYALMFSLGINNFAHGSSIMLGAYISFLLLAVLKLPFIVCLLLTLIGGGAIGLLLSFFGVEPFLKSKNSSIVIVATLAISLLVDNVVFIFQGPNSFSNRANLLIPKVFEIYGVIITNVQLVILFTSFIVLTSLFMIVFRSEFGLRLRAVADDIKAASVMGFSPLKIVRYAFVLAGALAFLAGLLMSFDYDLNSQVGTGLLLKAYTATIIGGAYHLGKVAIAAYIVGILESLVAGYLSSEFTLASVFVLLTFFLLIRKEGLNNVAILREI